MKKNLFLLLFLVIIIIIIGCKKNIQYKIMWIGSETDIEIKEKPNVKSKTVDTLTFGEPVNLVAVKGTWSKILWNEKVFWISGNLTDIAPDDEKKYFNLLERIKNVKKGDTIKIAEGIYDVDISDGLIINSKEDIIFRKSNDNIKVKFVSSSSKNVIINIKNCKNITIDGIVLYLDADKFYDNEYHECVLIENSKNITITGCDIYGSGVAGIEISGNGSRDMKILKNSFHNCSDGGIYEDNSDGEEMRTILEDNIEWTGYLDPLYELMGEYEAATKDDCIYKLNISKEDINLNLSMWIEESQDSSTMPHGIIKELLYAEGEDQNKYSINVEDYNNEKHCYSITWNYERDEIEFYDIDEGMSYPVFYRVE